MRALSESMPAAASTLEGPDEQARPVRHRAARVVRSMSGGQAWENEPFRDDEVRDPAEPGYGLVGRLKGEPNGEAERQVNAQRDRGKGERVAARHPATMRHLMPGADVAVGGRRRAEP